MHHAHGSWEVSVLSDSCTAAKRYDHCSIASDFADEGSGEHVAANGIFLLLYINSSLSLQEYRETLREMKQNGYRIVYVAPERLHSEAFLKVCSQIQIPFLAVDEAHCISQWGQDFRPSYLTIRDFTERLPDRPTIGAFTATATPDVRQDIEELLDLEDPFSVTTTFDRPNLSFTVRHPTARIRSF